MDKNRPAKVLWDGNIKASIFANTGPKGTTFATSYARIYTDPKSGQVKEAYSFSGAENLRISELARRAHHATNSLRADYNARASQESQVQSPQYQTSPRRQPAQAAEAELPDAVYE